MRTLRLEDVVRVWATAVRMALAGVALAVFPACDYFGELVDPDSFEPSLASVTVVLADTNGAMAYPIADAVVTVDGSSARTDSVGVVEIADVRTGDRVLAVTHPHYFPVSDTFDVTLEGASDTLFPARRPQPPVIVDVMVEPSVTHAVDDTIQVTLDIEKPVWPIETVIYVFGDGDTAFHGSRKSHAYNSAGTYVMEVLIVNENGDTARAAQAVTVSANRRPQLDVVLSRGGSGFYFGEEEGSYIRVNAFDPDSDLSHIEIRWGDGEMWSSFILADGYSGVHPHTYLRPDSLPDSVSTAYYDLAVTAFDQNGAIDYFTRKIPVLTMPPLEVQAHLEFSPSSVVTISDSTITLGVRVLSSPGYIRSVLWTRDDNVFLDRFVAADSTEGALGPDGRLFQTTLVIGDALADTNVVAVRVSDSQLQTRTVRDTFIVLNP